MRKTASFRRCTGLWHFSVLSVANRSYALLILSKISRIPEEISRFLGPNLRDSLIWAEFGKQESTYSQLAQKTLWEEHE